ncbi:hypothetical protein RJ035_007349 [Blastomyces gilchristii]
MSLGRACAHDLPIKLSQASRHGFKGIELFYEDLESHAQALTDGLTHSNQLTAAQEIRQLCDKHNLQIVTLQPFLFYEGLLDRAEHHRLLNGKLALWFQLVKILRTDMIQIPANFLGPDPGTGKARTTGDLDVIVSDLREVAERGVAGGPARSVRRVDRANFGICLDTFNLAGRVYADPAVRDGKMVNADANLRASLARLVATIDVRKVFYIQVVDGERLERPLVKGHEWHVSGQPSRMSWSRNARLFAFEEDRGGYLPILAIARAFFDLGFEGWISLELFSRSTADPKPDIPAAHARRGAESWRKLVRYLGLKVDVSWHIAWKRLNKIYFHTSIYPLLNPSKPAKHPDTANDAIVQQKGKN